MTDEEKMERFQEVLRRPGAKVLMAPDVFDAISAIGIDVNREAYPFWGGFPVEVSRDLPEGTVVAVAMGCPLMRAEVKL